MSTGSVCVCLRLCFSICVCVCVFYCVLLSSPQYEFTFSPEWKSGKPCWCTCVWVCLCVCVSVHYMHLRSGSGKCMCVVKWKGWRLYVCECVSFSFSLSECLFLDQFEGQGLATGGEKLCSHLKGKKSSRSHFTMKRRLNTHHPLKALTLALPYSSLRQRSCMTNVLQH